MKKFVGYYDNTKIYLVKQARSSTFTKIVVLLVLWALVLIPTWIGLGMASLLGVTPGLVAVIAFGIFIFFAGSTQLALIIAGVFLTLGIAIA